MCVVLINGVRVLIIISKNFLREQIIVLEAEIGEKESLSLCFFSSDRFFFC